MTGTFDVGTEDGQQLLDGIDIPQSRDIDQAVPAGGQQGGKEQWQSCVFGTADSDFALEPRAAMDDDLVQI
jgi:hypothetical protein